MAYPTFSFGPAASITRLEPAFNAAAPSLLPASVTRSVSPGLNGHPIYTTTTVSAPTITMPPLYETITESALMPSITRTESYIAPTTTTTTYLSSPLITESSYAYSTATALPPLITETMGDFTETYMAPGTLIPSVTRTYLGSSLIPSVTRSTIIPPPLLAPTTTTIIPSVTRTTLIPSVTRTLLY